MQMSTKLIQSLSAIESLLTQVPRPIFFVFNAEFMDDLSKTKKKFDANSCADGLVVIKLNS